MRSCWCLRVNDPAKSGLVPDVIRSHARGESVRIAQRRTPVISYRDVPKTIRKRYGVAKSTANAWMSRR